ncbi:hypothetical protein ACTFIW_002739 [Dictyostelium discoideum]
MTQNFNTLFFKVWHNDVIRIEIFIHIKKFNNNQYHYNNWRKLIRFKTNEILNQLIEKRNNSIHEIISNNNNINNNTNNNKIYKNNLRKSNISLNNFMLNPKLSDYVNFINCNLEYNKIFERNENFFKEKDGNGQNFFHYFCQYKTGGNYKEDFEKFKGLRIKLDEQDKRGENALFYTIKNKKLGLEILDFLLRNNICTTTFLNIQFISKCSDFDFLKLFFAHQFDLSPIFSFFISNIDKSDKMRKFYKKLEKIVQTCSSSINYDRLKDKVLYKRLVVLQHLSGGDVSSDSIHQILHDFGLGVYSSYKFHLHEDSKNLKLYLFYVNFRLDHYKTKYDLSEDQIKEIDKLKIFKKSQINLKVVLFSNRVGKGYLENVFEAGLSENNNYIYYDNKFQKIVIVKHLTLINESEIRTLYSDIAANNSKTKNSTPKVLGLYHWNDILAVVSDS